MLKRSWWVGRHITAAAAAAALLAAVLPARADYLDDARTARGVEFGSPRAPLADCLKVLSSAARVELVVSPALAAEALTGYVPRRPLRETMRALEELFDAAWVPSGGASPVYALTPAPEKSRAHRAVAAEQVRRAVRAIDDQAEQAALDSRAGRAASDRVESQRLALSLWLCLTPAARVQLLQGVPLTLPVPESRAPAVYRQLLLLADKPDRPLVGPMLATFDLDDQIDTGIPWIRARVTAMRHGSIVGALGMIDWLKVPAANQNPADPPAEGPALPAGVGVSGRFHGTRDEQALKIGQALNLPILSRHRSWGGTGPTVMAGGRRLPEVMADYAAGCAARVQSTARGFQLLRSVTESFDSVGRPPDGPVRRFLAARPKVGEVVGFEQMLELGSLTPMQLAILQRGNVCTAEASFAVDNYAILRFYQALNPSQRRAVFSDEGLDAAALTHAQLHALLDAKLKRADWDIHAHLQTLAGLRFRFRQQVERDEKSITYQALREGRVVSGANADLPSVEEEERPAATP